MSNQLSLIDYINQCTHEKIDEVLEEIDQEIIFGFDQSNYISRKKAFKVSSSLANYRQLIKRLKILNQRLELENLFLKKQHQSSNDHKDLQEENKLLKEALESSQKDAFTKQLAYKELSEKYEKLRSEKESINQQANLKISDHQSKINQLEKIIDSHQKDYDVRLKQSTASEFDLKNEMKNQQEYLRLFSEKILDLVDNLKSKTTPSKNSQDQLKISDHLPEEQQEIIFVLAKELRTQLNDYAFLNDLKKQLLNTSVKNLDQLKKSIIEKNS